MIDLNAEEGQLITSALHLLAKQNGLSNPQQYGMSLHICNKISEDLAGRNAVAPTTGDQESKDEVPNAEEAVKTE